MNRRSGRDGGTGARGDAGMRAGDRPRRDASPRGGRERQTGPGAAARPAGDPDVVPLWGTHAVVEALAARRRKPLRLYATAAAAERAAALAAERGIPLDIVPGDAIAARVPRDAVHQGLLLEARRLPPVRLEDVADDGVVLVLDQVTDPHNVGAILRSAAAFAVSAVVMTDRNAPDLGGTLAKAASGALEHVPVVLVVNLARTLDALGDRGFLRVGLDSDGETALETMALPRPLALVLGSEGQGLRRLTRERCDAIARLDLPGAIRSLNVSTACAVALAVARFAVLSSGADGQ